MGHVDDFHVALMSDGLKRRGLSMATRPSPARTLRVVGHAASSLRNSLPDKRIPCPGKHNSLRRAQGFPAPSAQGIQYKILKTQRKNASIR
jgi:hypothetical protein